MPAKIKMHKDFIRLRAKEAENKYKIYKNKLTNIITTCKKSTIRHC